MDPVPLGNVMRRGWRKSLTGHSQGGETRRIQLFHSSRSGSGRIAAVEKPPPLPACGVSSDNSQAAVRRVGIADLAAQFGAPS